MTINLQSYSTGTVAVEQGSATVVLSGAGAAWPSSWCKPGCQVVIAGEAQTNYVAAWTDDHTVELALPVARATAADLAYSILVTAPAFGTNLEAALTNIERIRLMSENEEIADFLALATAAAIWPAHDDLIAVLDKGDDFKIKPTTINLLYRLLGSVMAKAADYTIEAKDIGQLVTVSAGGAARIIGLPSAATVGVGFTTGIKKIDTSANTVTITAAGGDTIDGAASAILASRFDVVWLRSDGANWHITSDLRRIAEGVRYDAAVETDADLVPYDDKPGPTATEPGFAVLIGNIGGTGRAGIKWKLSDDSADWSDPAYLAPAVDITADPAVVVPFGTDPSAELTSDGAGGYTLKLSLPSAANLLGVEVDTLPPGSEATAALLPGAGGYGLVLGIPQGAAGTIDGLTAFWQNLVTTKEDAATSRAALEIGRAIGVNVLDHGAVADGATDDGGAFAAAQAAAITDGSMLVVVPGFHYRIDTLVSLATGVAWLFLGATLEAVSDITVLSADTITDWSILGAVQIIGNRAGVGETAQHGLYIKNCERFAVEGVVGRALKGRAFWMEGAASAAIRGESGRFSNCGAFECSVGRQLDAGNGSEFTSWSNWNAAGNAIADKIGAGNTITVGGSIVDNTSGVELVAGSNHGHGIYNGVQINHNDTNLTATDIVTGFTFSGCHFYEGPLTISNCDGIVIEGGTVDISAIAIADGANAGFTRIRNAWFDDGYGPLSITGTGTNKLIVQGCTGPGVPARNTQFEIEAHVYRNKASTMALTPGGLDVAIFPGEVADPAGIYNPATGVFTIPISGVYELSWSIVCGGTGLTASTSYVEIQADADGGNDSYTSQVFSGAVPFGTTLLTFTGTTSLRLTAGLNVRFMIRVNGTSPVMGSEFWFCLADIKKLGS